MVIAENAVRLFEFCIPNLAHQLVPDVRSFMHVHCCLQIYIALDGQIAPAISCAVGKSISFSQTRLQIGHGYLGPFVGDIDEVSDFCRECRM